jgi:ribosomal protein S18 acetylase RimI-like enzyme
MTDGGSLVARGYQPEDLPRFVEILNAANAADGLKVSVTLDQMANWYSRANEHFDAARDAVTVARDGTMVAMGDIEWVDTTDGLRELRLGGAVHPTARRQGVGRWLLHHLEAMAIARSGALPATDRPLVFGSWNPEARVGGRMLLEQEGYAPARHFFDMLRPTLDEIAIPELPAGLEVRPMAEADLRRLWDADVEAFLDHWGGFDGSEERYQAWLRDPIFDPSLFVIAWEGDQIAGGVINMIDRAENEKFGRAKGWLASVFTRRPWRRRGLASALVARSLVVFRDRGMTSAGLGVDAANPNGALGLYERAGFEVEWRSTAYRKPFPEG